jgi:hypothetical protein
MHGATLAGTTQVTSWDTPAEETRKVASASGESAAPAERRRVSRAPARTPEAQSPAQEQEPARKKGLFRRILDMFK